MKKFIILIFVLQITSLIAYNQIYSNVQSVKISNSVGMPPDLYAKFSFEDYNGNNVLEAEETAFLTMIISNVGKSTAENLIISVKSDKNDKNLIIKDKKKIAKLYPSKTDTFKIEINALLGVTSNTHNLTINVSESNGFDMQAVSLKLPTLEYQKPELILSGLNIIETGDDVYIKNYDGKIQKGERVKVKISIQNIGKNIAQNVNFSVSSNDKNIQVFDNTSKTNEIKIGELKEFTFAIMVNNLVTQTDKLPLYLNASVRNNLGEIKNLQLPIVLDQKPPEPQVVDIKPDYSNFDKQATFEFDNNQKYSVNQESSVDNDIPKNPTKPNTYALIIGNSKYKTGGSDIADLVYTLNDARVFKKYVVNVLGVQDDVQHIYYIENANYSSMLTNLENFSKLIKMSKPEDVFYVYYSGHGAQNADSVAFLMPVDAKMNMLEKLAVKLDDFYNYITPPADKGTVIVFLDACFSGQNLSTIAKVGVRRNPKDNSIASNLIVLAASSGKEISQEYASKSHGLFTYFLLKILQDTKGNITYGELSTRINEEVRLTTLNPQNGFVEQNPQVNVGKSLVNTWKQKKIY